jgi:hypothetical protein
MPVRTKLAVLSLSAVLGFSGLALAHDHQKQEQKPEVNEMGMTQEQMATMMKNMTPGEAHKQLGKLAGDWTMTSRMFMVPGQPPVEAPGTMHAETILDGRYVQSTWKGSIMGQPFEGRGTDGWDNTGQKYVSSWVDNMGTGILYSTGTCENGFKVCTTTGDMLDSATGQKITMKSVVTWIDDNHFKNEMYHTDHPSGQEVKMMELDVVRKK